MLASVVESWSTSGIDNLTYARTYAHSILDVLRQGNPACVGIELSHKLSLVSENRELRFGLGIARLQDTALMNLLRQGHLSAEDILRMPKQQGCLLMSHNSVSRDEFGPLAAWTAAGMALVRLEHLRQAIWLATGFLPSKGDIFIFEQSAYPAVPTQRIRAPLKSIASGDRVLTDEDCDRLAGTLLPLGIIWGDLQQQLERRTDLALRLALSSRHTLLESPDDLLVALLAYISIEGLLLNKEDDDSRLDDRVAYLIGATDHERRDIRKFMSAYRSLRGYVAHGEPANLDDLSKIVGKPVSAQEFSAYFSWAGHQLGKTIRQKCLETLRKVLLACLCLATKPEQGPSVSPHMTRKEIIELTEIAAGPTGAKKEEALNILQKNVEFAF